MGLSHGGAGVIIIGVILNDLIKTVRSLIDPRRWLGVYYTWGSSSTISSGLNKIPIDDMLPATKFEEMSSRRVNLPESCRICQEEFDGGEDVRCLRNCVHVYHRACIDRWIRDDKMTCPLCRTPIVPDFYFFRL
ncbi:hypothetical protein CARUB_v10003429mg [Capsella rubella]|uniref:RING-type domain-containing protein n=1 Tax=Capsella rubella TaxID=81985 RepID=R0FJU7_9BRAS|nr:E3 ubiquitin-protein ligase RHA1B [Capsella rubella]EOA22722.1 hypothetical protein CARUB_v10003429mg [Capsella rubella]